MLHSLGLIQSVGSGGATATAIGVLNQTKGFAIATACKFPPNTRFVIGCYDETFCPSKMMAVIFSAEYADQDGRVKWGIPRAVEHAKRHGCEPNLTKWFESLRGGPDAMKLAKGWGYPEGFVAIQGDPTTIRQLVFIWSPQE